MNHNLTGADLEKALVLLSGLRSKIVNTILHEDSEAHKKTVRPQMLDIAQNTITVFVDLMIENINKDFTEKEQTKIKNFTLNKVLAMAALSENCIATENLVVRVITAISEVGTAIILLIMKNLQDE